jgi:hypothetical protein
VTKKEVCGYIEEAIHALQLARKCIKSKGRLNEVLEQADEYISIAYGDIDDIIKLYNRSN